MNECNEKISNDGQLKELCCGIKMVKFYNKTQQDGKMKGGENFLLYIIKEKHHNKQRTEMSMSR
jgi:hypothetical protein